MREGRGKERQRAGALQDANATSHAPDNAKRLGVRLPSGAFPRQPRTVWNGYRIMVERYT